MPKSSGELADEIEGEYGPEDYEDYEELITDIKNKYGSGIISNLSFSEEDFTSSEEIEEEEEEIDDNSSNDREITTSAIANSNETSSGISKAVRGFLGRFRL